jgi:hypothetical protein
MSNGTDLNGHRSSTQSAIAVKKNGSNPIYYIFINDELARVKELSYSEVNMS